MNSLRIYKQRVEFINNQKVDGWLDLGARKGFINPSVGFINAGRRDTMTLATLEVKMESTLVTLDHLECQGVHWDGPKSSGGHGSAIPCRLRFINCTVRKGL